MNDPKPEIVVRDGIVYRLVKVPEGQKRVQRSNKARRQAVARRSSWTR